MTSNGDNERIATLTAGAIKASYEKCIAEIDSSMQAADDPIPSETTFRLEVDS